MRPIKNRGDRMKPWLAALCTAAAMTASSPAAAAEAAVAQQDDVDADYRAMTDPVLRFLNLIARKFPGRECVRDRSHLNDDYDKLQLSLLQMFVIRDDLRKDLREVAMRLATFQALPADVRHLAIPIAVPPVTESQKAVNAQVVRIRIALWKKLDELESKFPAAAARGRRQARAHHHHRGHGLAPGQANDVSP